VRRRTVLFASVVLVAATASVTGVVAGSSATAKTSVQSWKQTFVDTSRPTPPASQTPGAPTRTLVTTIYRPSGRGPFPLIVFSHGLNGHPDKFTQLLSSWAAAGYVIAAPAYPNTNSTVPGVDDNYTSVASQPGDVSFILDQLLRLNRAPGRLHRAIDPKRIGAGGLSLGGATTYGVTYADCCRDDRIKAAEVLDGVLLPVGDGIGAVKVDGHVPLLIVHSDTDPALPYVTARNTYDASPGPLWFVTLHGASHASQWENDPTPFDAMDERLTLAFWNATLRHAPNGIARFEHDAVVPGMSSLEQKP
jgi:dienelactone hydrolase